MDTDNQQAVDQQTINQQAMDALKQVALAGIVEQRRSRRWTIFFRIIMLFVVVSFVLMMGGLLGSIAKLSNPRLTAIAEGENYAVMVSISGVIMEGQPAGADSLIQALQEAFADDDAKGVILRCNSPGGSPVQSNQVYQEIMRLREKHPEKPVYAVADDVCASGGYYIVAAAQNIYADKSSIVGSIGVRMDSFGFVDAMKTLGVESRQITAGENKALLDPFKPQKAEDIKHLETMLANTHQHFIDAVRGGRGDRLDEKANPDLFTGLFWSGDQAKALGLIDDFGSVRSVAREQLDSETIVDYTLQSDFFDRLSRRVEASVKSALNSTQQFMLR